MCVCQSEQFCEREKNKKMGTRLTSDKIHTPSHRQIISFLFSIRMKEERNSARNFNFV